MSLQFQGELGFSTGLLLALLLGMLAAAIYFREVRGRRDRVSRLLPILRGLAVTWLLLALIGPVLRSEETIPLSSRILVFVDASQSMKTLDPQINPDRKKAIASVLGLIRTDDLDEMSRWRRGEIALTRRDNGLLAQLLRDKKDEIDVFALHNEDSPRVWSSQPTPSFDRPFSAEPNAPSTDLVTPIEKALGQPGSGEPPIAAILFSDGQHNHGPGPTTLVQLLTRRKLPLFTVAMGDTSPPPDLAVVSTDAPEIVFIGDRLIGHIVLKDQMSAGTPFTLSLSIPSQAGGTPFLVWQKKLITEGSGERKIDFDFPIRAAGQHEIDRLSSQGIEVGNLPLQLEAVTSSLPGERTAVNNRASLRVRIIKNKRKVLILDGRPRWETRFLRDLFERDQQWEVNLCMLGTPLLPTGPLPRGSTPGTFPKDRDTLLTYDLVVLGEIPANAFQAHDLESLRDFVGDRGGGLIIIDGPRGHLAPYINSPLSVVFPIKRVSKTNGMLRELRLTSLGENQSAFHLLPDKSDNAQLWSNLSPPHWAAGVTAQPGSETLLEGMVGNNVVPLIVTWRFGAGRVWYHAFEETWRWRYNVADLYHQRFWNQVAAHVMDQPFAMRDRFVSLDVGGLVYEQGDSARIRAKIVDSQGHSVAQPEALAVIYRNGQRIGTTPLSADDKTGILSGVTPPLDAGSYEVGVEVKGLPASEMKVRVGFSVHGGMPSVEMSNLACNEVLLRQLAESTNGQLVHEEDLSKLPPMIGNLARTRVVEHHMALWRGWSWFVPFLVLLSIEWMLRKKLGMI
ncbi:MAG: hypothetical protein IT444_06400 [Phycisphaeraceae bacterium]|nr:hypothetical protein [Phycisphaeraceae bacterium]